MRFVIAFIAVVAAVMVWALSNGDCRGGSIVADAQQCAKTFDAQFCARAMEAGMAKARTAAGSFPTQAKCLDHYPVCIERSDILAWTQKPTAWCIARGPGGEVARVDPVYAIR